MEILKKKVNTLIIYGSWPPISMQILKLPLKRRKLHMRFLLICRSRDLL